MANRTGNPHTANELPRSPGTGDGKMSNFLVEPLSIAQALISFHRIKGSCIPVS